MATKPHIWAARLMALVLLASTLALATGCGNSFNYIKSIFGYNTDDPTGFSTDEAAILANKAQERMDADDYAEAAELWQQLRDQYLASPYSMLAALRLGDAYYLNKKYIESANAYETFEKRYPLSDAIPYVLYQRGMSHYQQMMGIDRDQTPAVQTVKVLGSLVESFPDDKYAAMAKARIAEAQNNMAGHEFYVGEFYFKRKDYQAAMKRFTGLITYYPDSGYHHRAYNYIAEYRDLVARGEIEEGNQRPEGYNSPFTITDINDERY